MKTKLFTFTLLIACTAAATNEVQRSELTIGTNSYKNVTITKRTPVDAVVRYDGGIAKVKISDLPDDLKAQWLDTAEAAKFTQTETAEIAASKKRLQETEKAKADAFLKANFLQVGDRALPKAQRRRVSGVVQSVSGNGVLLRERFVRQIRAPAQRPGSYGEYRPVLRSEESFGKYIFVRHARAAATGSSSSFEAFDLAQTINVGGIQADLQVSEKARPEDVSKDWIVHFFDRCRLTSDEEMQKLWAKVLAGEAEQPTTFSKRTLDVIGTLEKFDAQNFELLCRFLWRLKHLPSPILYGFDMNSLKAMGLPFGRIQHLSELGLVSIRDGLAFTQHWDSSQQVVSYFGRHVEVTLPKGKAAMNVGLVMLTRVGLDLASICTVQPVDDYFDEVVNLWRNTYHYTVKEVPPPISQSGMIGSRDDISTKPPEAAPPVWG